VAFLPFSTSFSFRRRTPPLLGLDIGASSIRLVSLEQGRSGRVSLDCIGTATIPAGFVVGDNIEKLAELGELVKKMVSKSGAKTKNVAMALPASALVTRRVAIQSDLSEIDFEAQVEAEIAPYLPWAAEESATDFVRRSPIPNSSEVEAIAVAAKLSKVEERIALAESSGLKLVALDLEPYVNARAFHFFARAKPGMSDGDLLALFSIGSVHTNFQVCKADDVVYERELTLGGLGLTQLIERTYGKSADVAEKQKRSRDLPSDYESKVLGPYMANLAIEIERGLQFFEKSGGQNKVSKILLSGGGACLSGLAKAVASQTGLACGIANPFEHINVNAANLKKKLSREGPGYQTAVGLALRRFA
jgi:type IV pilus assembly protein PilM